MSAGKGRRKESIVFKFFTYHVDEDVSECGIAECKAKLKVSKCYAYRVRQVVVTRHFVPIC